MPDPINDVASDWELAFLGGVAAAAGGGAGWYFAVFRSARVGALEPFYLAASGLGAGGNASGFDPRNMSGLPFGRVNVVTPFSIRMLHNSAGFLAGASVGVWNVNYGYSYMDAGRNGVKFFTNSGGGAALGSGAGVIGFAGIWYSHALNGNSANPATAYGHSIMDSINELLGSWDRGIRNIYSGGM